MRNSLIILTVILSSLGAQTSFGSGTKISGSNADGPKSVAAVDIDGDGDLDLVTGAMQSAHMQVFLNQGAAAFRRTGRLSTGARTFHVQVAELNGDLFPEVVSANEGSGTITVWLNRADGNGTFIGRRDYQVGRQPACSDAVDLNGDGFNDLVVSNRGSRNISVLLNLGNGRFGAATEVPVDGAPYYVAGGDMNRDGVIDLVVANPSSQSIIILQGRGDGTFDAGISYDAVSYTHLTLPTNREV